MAKKSIYAVAAGRQTGIFNTWAAVEQLVKGFAGARYKGFSSRDEAEAWLENPAWAARPAKSTRPSGTGKAGSCQRPEDIPQTDDLLIYTDGGCINNPGPGGYGVVICRGDERTELSGGFRLTTNNRMEITAALVALRAAGQYQKKVHLYSDSSYLVNGIEKGWAKKWRQNGWLKAEKTPVLHVDLWQELLELTGAIQVVFHWVKGHAGNSLNERCDQLAVGAARGKGLPVDSGYEAKH